MKKLLLFLAVSAIAQTSFAGEISKSLAAKRARSFMTNLTGRTVSVKNVEISDQSEALTYYAFNNASGQGYVLLSADDQMPEMLAYSPTGKWPTDVNQIPPALRQILSNYSNKTQLIRKGKMAAPRYTASATANYAKYVVSPLLTTAWKQSYPYNMNAPEFTGESMDFSEAYQHHYPIGCAAVALGQVMNYWKYPEHPVEHNYRYKVLNTFSSHLVSGSTTYDYANIPDSINRTAELSGMTQDEWNTKARAIGKFLGDVAYAMNMEWDTSGGGASECIGQEVAILGFDYSYETETKCTDGTGILSNFWDLIKDDLDHKRPIYCGGTDSRGSGGHAFVIDGYDEGNFVHVNWGWGGVCNDLHVDPNILGSTKFDERESGNYAFNSENVFLHNMHPRTAQDKPIEYKSNVRTPNTFLNLDFSGSEMRKGEELDKMYDVSALADNMWDISYYCQSINFMGAQGPTYDLNMFVYNTNDSTKHFFEESSHVKLHDTDSVYIYDAVATIDKIIHIDSIPDGIYGVACKSRCTYNGETLGWMYQKKDPVFIKDSLHVVLDTALYKSLHYAKNCIHWRDSKTRSFADLHMILADMPEDGYSVGDTIKANFRFTMVAKSGVIVGNDEIPCLGFYVEKDGESQTLNVSDDDINVVGQRMYEAQFQESLMSRLALPSTFVPTEAGTYKFIANFYALDKTMINEIVVKEKSPSGINQVQNSALSGSSATYNLAGQKVNPNYRGIIIREGKKSLMK